MFNYILVMRVSAAFLGVDPGGFVLYKQSLSNSTGVGPGVEHIK
jgi:hypothetical protein